MIFAPALALLVATPVPEAAQIDLAQVCVTGDAVAADLLRQRLAERGARGDTCSVRITLEPGAAMAADGFRIERGAATITARARSTRGLVQAAGLILGETDGLILTLPDRVEQSPRQAVRGTQIGYRPKNNSYDAWTPAMLEAGWQGDPAANPQIAHTLAAMDAVRPAPWAGWRTDLYRYRAVMDALVQERWRRAAARQSEALYVLRQAPAIGADAAAAGAVHAFARPETARSLALRARLIALADRLRAQAGMQLSVDRHGASDWRRGANLDRIDVALDDGAALAGPIKAALALPDEAARVAALAALGDPWGMGALALHDDLGVPGREPHLVRGPGLAADPQGWRSAIDGINDQAPGPGWRLAEVSYAEALFEHPLTLRYTGLETDRSFRLRYTRAGEDYALPLRLTANGEPLDVPAQRTGNPQTIEIALPRHLTRSGTLKLVWQRPPRIGGGGRGRQIAEVWLIPEPLAAAGDISLKQDGTPR